MSDIHPFTLQAMADLERIHQLEARIAELEANLAAWQKQAALMEAERDRLKAALRTAVLAEREACAVIADARSGYPALNIAAAIRARLAP